MKTPLQKLWFLTKEGNFHKFKTVFEKFSIDVNSIDKDNNTLLNFAVQCDNEDIASYLIKSGAEINLQNVKLF